MRYIVRAILIILLLPIRAVWAASPTVVISELQTGTSASASQEFVELYNPTDSDVSLSGWSLQYKSATSIDQPSSWSKKATLTGTIKSHGFYLIAPTTYLSQADANLSAGLSGTGGHVRLIDGVGTAIDLLGWGTANAAETTAAPAPPADQSLERLPGRLIEDGGNAVDSDDNSKDFVIRTAPLPQSTKSDMEAPAANDTTVDSDPTAGEPAPQPQTYLPIQITELLVNPAAPLNDTNDEFIELYNPNSTDINLQGYTLKTGSNFHDYYVLPNLIAPADGYVAVYASESHLSLTNTGGAAELLDPTGQLINLSEVYDSAPEGQSWGKFDGGWQWTLQTTPARPNVLVQPVLKDDLAQATSSAAKKITAAKPASTPKSTAKAATTKTAAKAPTTKTLATKKLPEPVVAAASSPAARWLLVGAVALTIGYAIYEFRYDIQNYYYLTRRKFGAGGKDRPAA